MDYINDFEYKREKFMPIFTKATGQPTVFIEGYPCEDGKPMGATLYHIEQISTFYEQIKRYFYLEPYIFVGQDCFIYYSEGNMRKCVAPDLFVVLGAKKYPLRRSYYIWAEGAVPDTVFKFLSDSTMKEDMYRKVDVYLREMGAKEYFVHQPDLERTAVFRGWYLDDKSGEIVEMTYDEPRALFSQRLNLIFKWEERWDLKVRLLRPYLPDGTQITTSIEEGALREEEQRRREEEQRRREIAEAKVEEQADKIREQEVELEKLRQQIANR